MKRLQPTFRLHRFTELTAEFLTRIGVEAILTDLDDTLAARDCFLPTEEVVQWISNLKKRGIRVCIISNNHEQRTEKFARALDLPYRFRAKKPAQKAILEGIRELGAAKEKTLLLGDQLFTDIAGAYRCGLRSVLVDPVGTYGGWFVQLKRRLEKPLRKKIDYTDLSR